MQEVQASQGVASVFELLRVVNAWSPAMPTLDHWNRWAQAERGLDPYLSDQSLTQTPDVSFLPTALRKKLSPLDKVALYLMHHTLSEELRPTTPIVMSSRFGEAQTTVELLEAVAQNEPSSPMGFSRSVHNSSVGLFSIANQNQASNTAISAMEYSFGAGLIETIVQLYQPDFQPDELFEDDEPEEFADSRLGRNVLYVYADEAIPEVYTPYVAEPPVLFGAAFLLEYQPSEVPMSELIHGLAEVECLDFLQFAFASC